MGIWSQPFIHPHLHVIVPPLVFPKRQQRERNTRARVQSTTHKGIRCTLLLNFIFLCLKLIIIHKRGCHTLSYPKKTKEKNSTWHKIEPQHKLYIYTKARVFRFLKFISRESRGQLVVCRSCKTIIFHIKDHFY